MKRKPHPTDLTDTEWTIIKLLVPKARADGRPRSVDMREIINTAFYMLRSGMTWRMLPLDLPRWKTVFHYFRLLRMEGIWEEMNEMLHEQVRVRHGRDRTPSAGAIDSQSAKTTEGRLTQLRRWQEGER